MTTEPLVSFAIENDVALVGINRPDKRNALNDAMFDRIGSLVAEAQQNAKAGILFGHGGLFSAGLDLAEQSGRSAIDTFHASRAQGAIMKSIEQGRIPWISVLSGATIGAGFELAAATHIRVAEENARFALPEGRRGIYVGGGGSVRIARLISVPRMTDMMLTARVMDAQEALAANAVQYVVAEGAGLVKARELAATMIDHSPTSNFAIINALPRTQDLGHDDGLFFESVMAALVTQSPEARAGLEAFLQKTAKRLDIP